MIRTLKLEDHGQDFLEWDVDASGVVVDTRPFQAWIWNGIKVKNIRVGRRPLISRHGGRFTRLKYPVVAIQEVA